MWECTSVWNCSVVSCEGLGSSLLRALLTATSLPPSFPRYTSQEPPLPIHCVCAKSSVIRDTSTKLYSWSWCSNPPALGVTRGVSSVDAAFCKICCPPCCRLALWVSRAGSSVDMPFRGIRCSPSCRLASGVTRRDPSTGVPFCETC